MLSKIRKCVMWERIVEEYACLSDVDEVDDDEAFEGGLPDHRSVVEMPLRVAEQRGPDTG
jgi:hypothetical protein